VNVLSKPRSLINKSEMRGLEARERERERERRWGRDEGG
jgi:hypothetical protein